MSLAINDLNLNMLLTLTFCLLFCPQIQPQNISFYPSDINLRPYLQTLKNVVDQLEEVKKDGMERLNLVTQYLDHNTHEHKRLRLSSDRQTYLGNPINQFIFVYSLTRGLDFVREVIRERRDFKKETSSLQYPGLEDVELNVIIFARLQRFYKLNVTQIAAGILNTSYSESGEAYVEKFSKMTSSDCYLIGKIMSKYRFHKEGVLWFIEALKLYNRDKSISDLDKETIYLYLSNTYKMLDLKKWTKDLPHHNSNEEMAHAIIKRQWKLNSKSSENQAKKKIFKPLQEVKKCTGRLESANYRRHCRAEMRVPPQITKSLKCWYFTGYHPFLRLAPIRTEQLYTQPDIFYYHNVIHDGEINNITSFELEECLLEASTKCVNNTVLECLKDLDYRHCMTRNIGRSADSITQRVSDFTGLGSAEYPIIATYYSAGSYLFTHTDSSRHSPYVDCAKQSQVKVDNATTKRVPNENTYINKHIMEVYGFNADHEQLRSIYNMCLYRVQTVLFYLTDVTQGGATVFPILGLTVWPKKGSALSWTTMYPPTANDVTCHSACPVLRGNKWVASKWINYNKNEMRRPCVEQFPNRHPIDTPPPVPKDVYLGRLI